MSTLAGLREWAAEQVQADLEAGRIPPMTPETADRIDAILGSLSPWRRPTRKSLGGVPEPPPAAR